MNEGVQPKVIYQDENFVALNKPAGLLVHDSRFKIQDSRKEPTLVTWLLEHFPEVKNVGDKPDERPGIVHRLDRDTSGVLVVARTQTAFEYLKKLFQEHKVKKTYLALVYGHINLPPNEEGVIERPIGIRSGSVKRTVHVERARMVKEAITKYQVLQAGMLQHQPVTLVRVKPLTGRTHQIRVHFAAINHPVVGDTLYGSKKQIIPLARHFLHADAIEFAPPGGGPNASRLRLGADLPQELQSLLDQMQLKE